jgi:membrane protein implicated in regulation of membrane protease activity
MFKFLKIEHSIQPRYRKASNRYLKGLLGRPGIEAIVDETIEGPAKKGRVKFRGSWWPAICEQDITLTSGQQVNVIGIHNITLIVEPIQTVLNR